MSKKSAPTGAPKFNSAPKAPEVVVQPDIAVDTELEELMQSENLPEEVQVVQEAVSEVEAPKPQASLFAAHSVADESFAAAVDEFIAKTNGNVFVSVDEHALCLTALNRDLITAFKSQNAHANWSHFLNSVDKYREGGYAFNDYLLYRGVPMLNIGTAGYRQLTALLNLALATSKPDNRNKPKNVSIANTVGQCTDENVIEVITAYYG